MAGLPPVDILGAGRVGTSLGHLLHRAGYPVDRVTCRTLPRARRAVRTIGAGRPGAGLEAPEGRTGLLLLTLPDDRLAEAAARLAGQRRSWRGFTCLHTSGVLPSSVLRPLARRGARVTGIDFSARSIGYARDAARKAGLSMAFEQANYLDAELPPEQDLVCLIYGDLCALSPEQRRCLYGKVRKSLKPGGRFVFDVSSVAQFRQRQEEVSYGRRLMDGFWAPGDYFGFLSVFLYGDRNIALDRYLIVEPHRSREIFNWLQYFDPGSIAAELAENGFSIEQVVDVLTGGPLGPSPDEFAVIARR